ncbi:hypothetical protein BOX15_Mlig010407g1 [Macrostomum lignano]|uniref:C2 domain-containing protein n=2 Tax=Macrostomum lignano TaxID=282301 RepID=A0A267EH74_9PLAT|nr:hypothetical protein BOX15_Mlig010407g1 [Macrostomum lignano]
MAGRKPTKNEMTANLLGGLGLNSQQQIEEGLYGRVEEDADLEAELNDLLGGGNSSTPSPEKRRAPAAAAAAKAKTRPLAAAADDDLPDDEDIDVDENDPELLNELQAYLGGSSPSPGRSPSKSPQPPPPPRQPSPPKPDLSALISERLAGYQRLLAATEDPSKRRRLERNVQTLNSAMTDARSGRPVDVDSLPPQPPKPPQPSQPQSQAAKVQQAVLDYVNPGPAAPPAASTGVGGPKMVALLEQRSREYRAAAAAAKSAGQTDEALELLRVHRQFDEAVKAVQGGETVDPDDVPGPPPPLTPKPPAPQAAQPPQQQQQQQPAAQPAAAKPSASGGGLAGELAARQAAYKQLQTKAQEAGDSGKARRMGRILSQYAEAVAAVRAGGPTAAGYDFSSLPPPPGFGPLPAATPAAAAKPAGSSGASAGAAAAAAATAMGGKAGAQLRVLMQRQQQYKLAAVQAKRTGDMATAKRMLGYARGCEPMLQAAQAGMPVDLAQLPPLPGESAAPAAAAPAPAAAPSAAVICEVSELPKELQGNALKDPEAVYDALEKTLKEKLALAEENARRFKSMGQITTADRWAKLGRSATADLDYLLGQRRLKRPPPKFNFIWQSVSAVRCNPDLGENTLEVKVLNGISLPLPEGFKESDLETQVKIELPISTESPLTQSTGWVKASANPSYDFATRFEVNRKARSTARVFKTRGLKFDVMYRRGFLKKDGLLGSATMKLEELETQCTLHRGIDLMDGRKAVGGRLEVQVRLREPLSGAQTDQVREQWLLIEHTNQELPPSRQASASRAGGSRAGHPQGSVPESSAYVLQYEISLLKPHAGTNSKAAEAVRGLEQRLAQHKQLLANCGEAEKRQYCSVLQQLSATYAQHAKSALQEKDRGKAEKFLKKKKEADREFQDVSSRLR